MRILFSTLNPPLPTFGGGALTAASIVKSLLESGNEVAVMWLDDVGRSPEEVDDICRALVQMGCMSVERIENPPAQKLSVLKKIMWRVVADESQMRPWSLVAKDVVGRAEKIQPDACLLYGWEAMCAFVGVNQFPKIGAIGNCHDKLIRVRLHTARSVGLPISKLRNWDGLLQAKILRKAHRFCVNSLSGMIAFAKNEAEEWSKEFPRKRIVYIPNFVPDDGANLELSEIDFGAQPWKVVHVGHMRGSATQDGLRWFAQEVIPVLKKLGVVNRFQFDFVGKFDPPQWLVAALKGTNSNFMGYIDDFEQYVRNAHAFIVPIPSDSGNRTRVATAWSLQCCVVTHGSTAWGMPEAVNELNCLIGNSPAEFAEQLVKACSSKTLNTKLREAGRVTFSKSYDKKVVMPQIEKFLSDCIQAKQIGAPPIRKIHR